MNDLKTELPLPPLQDRISFLFHRVNAHLLRVCNPQFEEWGLDLVTSRMLVLLLEKGPLPVGDIVKCMALPQSTISHQVKRLEVLGFLNREKGRQDSRMMIASLTARGQKVAKQANGLSKVVTDLMIEAIGEGELADVRDALKRVDTALGNFSVKQE